LLFCLVLAVRLPQQAAEYFLPTSLASVVLLRD